MDEPVAEEMLVRHVGPMAADGTGPALVVLTSPSTGMVTLDATAYTRAVATPLHRPFMRRFARIDRRG